ncbi:MAG: ATP-binding protein [Bacteroidales bacterium]|nr:ATP-binding protein [Bacteroidales bacterium]
MILKAQLKSVIDSQNENFISKKAGISRDVLPKVPHQESFATIITGIRRCGKSTLLLQYMQSYLTGGVFLNFEDIRLANFESSDFSRFYEILVEQNEKQLILDEIQLIPKWEIFVNQLLREGFKIFISGSNATMLSRELGTHLTGRNLTMELFPFSYPEFLRLKGVENSSSALLNYLEEGGFPEFLKTNNTDILVNLVNDILVRDIAIRHAIRDIDALKKLTLYLISNIGKPVSATNISGMTGFKSVSTIIEYFSYLEEAYLLSFIPQFSFSIKSQIRNPKKVYCIDNGIISVVSKSFSEDIGRKLENLVFVSLRRKNRDIFYFKDKGECDFVIQQNDKIVNAIQVSYDVNDLNFNREVDGLLEAMDFFDLEVGIIVTLNQKDSLERNGRQVKIIPLDEFLADFVV